ncbi:MurR/RpiR family transcriptional regulator [Ensifer adhaerens]|uniref:MurR/RpiR family transcriptional regulator n=1 Tax=Ensifer adhaerens TaxID=106592 RepID=UPI003D089FF2
MNAAFAAHDEARQPSGQNGDAQARSLELEIANTKEWQRAVKRLANTRLPEGAWYRSVLCLQYLRPGVQLADISGGNSSEILLNPPKSTCLVIFEARRYSRLNLVIAREAKKAKIPITLVTDSFCDWGRDHSDAMFVVPTDFGMCWDSTAQMASLGNLLINSVFHELGDAVEGRLDKVSELHGRITRSVGD